MQIDIKGKIAEKKLGFNNTLLPLYEAIVNSIHAIEEKSFPQGIIDITIVRSKEKELDLNKNTNLLPPIVDFEIKDNGIGFTEHNFDSFNFAHSTYKLKKGGKGIGRFTWLRAFNKVEIESYYMGDNNIPMFRKFNFEATKTGIEKHTNQEQASNSKIERYTIVRLKNLKDEYKKWCNNNLQDIAFRIIEHCFIYFLNQNCPVITIVDSGEKIIINDLFNVFTKGQVTHKNIQIREVKFTLQIVTLYHNDKIDNKIHYCANTREVVSDKISLEIPEFDGFLIDNEANKFSIGVYVESDYLNSNVNDERTGISFYSGDIEFADKVTQEELRKAIITQINLEFADQINKLSIIRVKKIEEFVSEHPQYKQLLKYKASDLKRIPSNLSDDKMELELFKIQQTLELDVKKEVKDFLKFINNPDDKNNFIKKHQELYSKIIEVGNSKLLEYVIHRKLVLELFEKMLKQKSTEDAVHNLIFPLRTFSDEVGFEEHNLWMIDDRLAYHKYLASDKKLKNIKPIDSNSEDRPDVIVFNTPFVFSNDNKPYESIVLIEFKRPMRDDYTDDENPIQQINKYARQIIEGEVKDKHDREFDFRENTPIYAYIICDLTKKLRNIVKDAGYKPLPNGDGFYFFNDNHNMYIEIMSFDKVLNDSKKRNRVLFDKLNIN